MTHLYPPGRIWWAVRDGDLHPSNRLPTMATSSTPPPPTGNDKNTEKDKDKDKGREKGAAAKKVRLFEVTDVEKVFSQIVFARDMLRWIDLGSSSRISRNLCFFSSHLPVQYDRVLHELIWFDLTSIRYSLLVPLHSVQVVSLPSYINIILSTNTRMHLSFSLHFCHITHLPLIIEL